MGILGGNRDSQESKDLNDASQNNVGFQVLAFIGALALIAGAIYGLFF